ncbi:MAG TPA: polymer-forming cytoskeletal protein [Nitrospira sp.]|jgi:cytoskeletal protein CcmA (bactofilin family)|nr:polymer-forming cytoskeletal protein [Nitrospira sp.]
MKKNGFGGDDNITLLAKGVHLKGEIRVDGTVRIDGRLEGEIHTKGQVIVGEDGLVQGIVEAGTVVSSGRIKATVTAVERVQLLKTAVLIGEVHTPVLMMEEGAKIQGTTDMGVSAWPDELPKLPGAVRELVSHRGKHVVVVEKDSNA